MQLDLDDVVLAAADGTLLIRRATIAFASGVTALVGSNGAGKSTLLNAIFGLHPLSEGFIRFNGIDNLRDRESFLAHSVFVPQNFTAYPELTGHEFLTYFLRLRGVSRADALARSWEWMEAVGLAHSGNRRTGIYSQGMLQRLGFAYGMQCNVPLCVLDEPFAGVDPDGRGALTERLFEWATDRVVILTTHHVEEATSRGARVVRIASGGMGFEQSQHG